MTSKLATGALLLALTQSSQVNNKEFEFGFRVPPGYKEVSPLPPGIHYGWRREMGDGTGDVLALTVEILPAAIGRDAADPKATRELVLKRQPDAVFDVHGLPWRDFELLVLETEVPIKGGKGLTMVAQVPTSPRALQVRVVGPLARKEVLAADLHAVLQSVTGKTNWIPPHQRWLLLFAGGAAVLGWTLWAVYGLVWSISFRTRPQSAPRFRAIWLGAVAVLVMIGVGLSFVLEGFRTEAPQTGAQFLGMLAALSAAQRATKLWYQRPVVAPAAPPG
jgi:hypothetical protein